jgi:hypothetical protein
VLDEHFEELLKRLRLDAEVFDLLRAALKENHADERSEREEARKRLSDEADKLQRWMDMIYLDRVEGRITADYHDRIIIPWRKERAQVIRNLEHLNSVDEAYVDDSIALLELVTNAHKGFAATLAKHKRRALNLVLSNCTWANGSLTAEFRQPFEMLRDLTPRVSYQKISNSEDSAQFQDLVTPTVARKAKQVSDITEV